MLQFVVSIRLVNSLIINKILFHKIFNTCLRKIKFFHFSLSELRFSGDDWYYFASIIISGEKDLFESSDRGTNVKFDCTDFLIPDILIQNFCHQVFRKWKVLRYSLCLKLTNKTLKV